MRSCGVEGEGKKTKTEDGERGGKLETRRVEGFMSRSLCVMTQLEQQAGHQLWFGMRSENKIY